MVDLEEKEYSLWYHIFYLEKMTKIFLKEGALKALNLTPTEYFLAQYFFINDRPISFYQLRNILPVIDGRQLHGTIKNLVDKGVLERNYKEGSSEIVINKEFKEKIKESNYLNYNDVKEVLSEEKIFETQNNIKLLYEAIESMLGKSKSNVKI